MSPASLRVTRATAEDVGAILPLFDAYRAFFAGRTDDTSQRFLQERLAGEESVVFVAWIEAKAAGFIQLYPLWSSWYCRRIWFLSDLYVSEAARGRGIGGALVQRVIAHANETEAASVMVELPRREPHLAEFYAKLGFAKDEVFELARYQSVISLHRKVGTMGNGLPHQHDNGTVHVHDDAIQGHTHDHSHSHAHYDGTVHRHEHSHDGADHDHEHSHEDDRDVAP
ncbi:MAG TPA: GNAT family N-acetyltransferase [Candidatus Cybelea sp.]